MTWPEKVLTVFSSSKLNSRSFHGRQNEISVKESWKSTKRKCWCRKAATTGYLTSSPPHVYFEAKKSKIKILVSRGWSFSLAIHSVNRKNKDLFLTFWIGTQNNLFFFTTGNLHLPSREGKEIVMRFWEVGLQNLLPFSCQSSSELEATGKQNCLSNDSWFPITSASIWAPLGKYLNKYI